MPDLPEPQGLYQPAFEHDACGVAFVVDMHGRRSHGLVEQGIAALCHLAHRGASGAEVNTGDGAGILIQVPDGFLRAVAGVDLPEPGAYATGIAFLPAQAGRAADVALAIDKLAAAEGLAVLGWRDVPTDASALGAGALATMPRFRQVFVGGGPTGATGMDLERRVFILRKRVEHEVDGVYFASLSSRTLVYKGMLTTPQITDFFPDLVDERLDSALALVHSRFSTNTFPSWPLAHPYRYLAHNGEINTLRGNQNWMRARQTMFKHPVFGADIPKLFPIIPQGLSYSAAFDCALEFLHATVRSLPHAIMMMIHAAWDGH
jgi:glutamate synthase (NADPH) large chain